MKRVRLEQAWIDRRKVIVRRSASSTPSRRPLRTYPRVARKAAVFKSNVENVESTSVMLARGRAILHDRHQLTEDDLPMVAHVALSSMPGRRGALLRTLVCSPEGQLTVTDAQKALDVGSPNTVRETMQDLAGIGLAVMDTSGHPATLRLPDSGRWVWLRDFQLSLFRGRGPGPVS